MHALDNIINHQLIYTLFQPIFDFKDGICIGYEALSRGQTPEYQSPLKLIDDAIKYNRLWDLELCFRKASIQNAKKAGINNKLFINVDPHMLNDPTYREGFTRSCLYENNIHPDNVIIEITERASIEDYQLFRKSLDHYRKEGFQIAMDDVGNGHSGLRAINEIRPNYIKIDMSLIKNIEKDMFKQELIKAFVRISSIYNTKIIAEGIESAEELKTLINLGVDYGQGYFLATPKKDIELDYSINKKIIIDIKNNLLSNKNFDYHKGTIGDIIENAKTFNPSTFALEIKDFLEDPQIDYEGVCITDNNIPVGLIMKNELDAQFASQYGYSIYSRRPISLIMDKNPLVVDYFTNVSNVVELVTKRATKKVYDNVVVTKNNQYAGLVSIKNLLVYSSNLEKEYMKEVNPLTSLPGNYLITQALQKIIKSKKMYCVIYVDLDNFKAYNDVYGFNSGDAMIKQTASILKKHTNNLFDSHQFVGHIGGDDFIIILNTDSFHESHHEKIIRLCESIVHDFTKCQKTFFNDYHIMKGFFYSSDRDKKAKKFPLTSISIACFHSNLNHFNSSKELGLHMANLKKEAKKTIGNSYLIKN